jgi:hypothetical protein
LQSNFEVSRAIDDVIGKIHSSSVPKEHFSQLWWALDFFIVTAVPATHESPAVFLSRRPGGGQSTLSAEFFIAALGAIFPCSVSGLCVTFSRLRFLLPRSESLLFAAFRAIFLLEKVLALMCDEVTPKHFILPVRVLPGSVRVLNLPAKIYW